MAVQTAAGSPLPPYPGLGLTLADIWSITVSSALGANGALVTKALAAGVKHVALRAYISFAFGATAQPAVGVAIRDGGTGAGNVLLTLALSGGANTLAGQTAFNYDLSNLYLAGTAGVAMTIESVTLGTNGPVLGTGVSAATGAFSMTLWGYDAA